MIESMAAGADSPRYQALRARLAGYSVYDGLRSITALRIFMQHHVYAVWDFMSLIKALQAQLAASTVPCVLSHHPRLAHLVNQLVLEEDSDRALATASGEPFASHFESNCLAMSEVGADTCAVNRLTQEARRDGLETVRQANDVPETAKRFMHFTFGAIHKGLPHQLAAVLGYGRESLVPLPFRSILNRLPIGPQAAPALHRDLQRHVELHSGEQGRLALNLVEDLCGDDASKGR